MSGDLEFGLLIWLVLIAVGLNRLMAKAKAAACSETGKKVAGAGIEYAIRRWLK